MFVLSLKAPKKKLIMWVGSILCICILAFLLLFNNCGSSSANTPSGRYNLNADSNDSRISFLAQFGWKVKENVLEVKDVEIPSEFNDTYEKYNEIQKNQGLDLSHYKGKSCKRYTYEVTNYPDKETGVHANILVKDNKVIGGDISSVEFDGFMHGFQKSLQDDINTQSRVESQANVETLLDVPVMSTERQTLAPDPRMPEAPTD